MRRVVDAIPLASGGAVMGTAVVSVALALDGRAALSELLMWIGVGLWIALAGVFGVRWVGGRSRLVSEASFPSALTVVAGTGVLGARLTGYGWTAAGEAALAVGALLAVALFPRVLRAWRRPTVGASFLVTVALQSLAVLSATLASRTGSGGLVIVAMALLTVGLGGYAWVLREFDFRELLTGRGDQWVAGGAVAVSALAAGRVASAAESTASLDSLLGAVEAVAVALVVIALAWLVPLVACELARPRLHFTALRWATVFPVGMYAAASFTVSDAAGLGWPADFAGPWVWAALAVWTLVAAATVRSAARTLSASLRAEPQVPQAVP